MKAAADNYFALGVLLTEVTLSYTVSAIMTSLIALKPRNVGRGLWAVIDGRVTLAMHVSPGRE
jgi:hypothetical protein